MESIILRGDTSQVSTRFGEVVEASSAAFTVHCYRLYEAPALGALVRTAGDEPIFAVVSNVETTPLDPARRPVARGADEPDQEAVYRANPQLQRLLRTDFQGTVVGYHSNGATRHSLPPRPPAIHAFVRGCSSPEVFQFTQRLDFLPLLLASSPPVADEVLAAFLRHAAEAHPQPEVFLTSAGREVAGLMARDLQRLYTVLKRLRP